MCCPVWEKREDREGGSSCLNHSSISKVPPNDSQLLKGSPLRIPHLRSPSKTPACTSPLIQAAALLPHLPSASCRDLIQPGPVTGPHNEQLADQSPALGFPWAEGTCPQDRMERALSEQAHSTPPLPRTHMSGEMLGQATEPRGHALQRGQPATARSLDQTRLTLVPGEKSQPNAG